MKNILLLVGVASTLFALRAHADDFDFALIMRPKINLLALDESYKANPQAVRRTYTNLAESNIETRPAELLSPAIKIHNLTFVSSDRSQECTLALVYADVVFRDGKKVDFTVTRLVAHVDEDVRAGIATGYITELGGPLTTFRNGLLSPAPVLNRFTCKWDTQKSNRLTPTDIGVLLAPTFSAVAYDPGIVSGLVDNVEQEWRNATH